MGHIHKKAYEASDGVAFVVHSCAASVDCAFELCGDSNGVEGLCFEKNCFKLVESQDCNGKSDGHAVGDARGSICLQGKRARFCPPKECKDIAMPGQGANRSDYDYDYATPPSPDGITCAEVVQSDAG